MLHSIASSILILTVLLLASCGTRPPPEPAAAPRPSTIAVSASPTAIPLSPTTIPLPPTAVPLPPTDQPTPPTPTPPRIHVVATLAPKETNVQEPQPTAAGTTPIDQSLSAFIDQAKADLAQRQGVALDAIAVLEARSVTWPNPGLGCPQPGMAYKQVPVDGLLIRLSLGGRTFSYHGGGGKPPFLCEHPAPKPPISPGQ